jgi:MFS family permease
VRRTFASLRYRNYRLFFTGQVVSQTGSWMQRIAMAWFVLQLTNSAFAVGVFAFAAFLPFTLFGLFAGAISDRYDARALVIGTQAAQLVTSAILAWIALAGIAEPWMLYALGFAMGFILVLDVPSRQQLTYRMVGRDQLPNAIALNMSLFNASRIFGPALAGVVYGFTGPGICFLINAISFLAVLLGLFAMRVRDFFPVEEFERPKILAGTREGLAYVLRDHRMLSVMILCFALSTFAFNFNVTLPVLAYDTLKAKVIVYSILSSLFGAGALVGALMAATRGRASTKWMLLGSTLFTGSELALAPVKNAYLACALIFFVGAGFSLWSANSNASMQLAAPPHLRGRIVGLYFYAFNGTASFAGFMVGWLCAHGGTQLAFLVAGVVGLAATLFTAIRLLPHGDRDLRVRGRLARRRLAEYHPGLAALVGGANGQLRVEESSAGFRGAAPGDIGDVDVGAIAADRDAERDDTAGLGLRAGRRALLHD